jgi:hypothetical protein
MTALPRLVLDPEGAACRGSLRYGDHMYTLVRAGPPPVDDRARTVPGRVPPDAPTPTAILYDYACIMCGSTLTADAPLCTAF